MIEDSRTYDVRPSMGALGGETIYHWAIDDLCSEDYPEKKGGLWDKVFFSAFKLSSEQPHDYIKRQIELGRVLGSGGLVYVLKGKVGLSFKPRGFPLEYTRS